MTARTTPSRPGIACRAFTLAEVLVVIGVLAVLMGLLLPAVRSARERGKATRCAANLAGIGQAARLYATENKDYILRAPHDELPGWRPWVAMIDRGFDGLTFGQMMVRASAIDLLHCPSLPRNSGPADYVVNEFVFDRDRDGDVTGGRRFRGPTKLAAVRRPSRVVFMAEITHAWCEWGDDPAALSLELQEFWANGLDVRAPGQLPCGPRGNSMLLVARDRHGTRRANALHFDGSVRLRDTINELRPTDFDDGIRDDRFPARVWILPGHVPP